jgi:tetratricopeptide (TPR) repeat protein
MRPGTLYSLIIIVAVLLCLIPPVLAADSATAPQDPAVALFNRADQYIAAGDYKNAILLLDRALAMNTSQFVDSGARLYALLDKSKAQIELGDYTAALATIDQALAIEETDKLWNNKGYVFFRLGRYDDAVTAYNTAIRITPDYTVALINKGDALMKLSKYQAAIDSYTKAMESDAKANDLSFSQKAKTWKDMGDAYYALGNYQAALSSYNSVLSIDPQNSDAAAALARAKQQADSGTAIMIVAVIAVVILCGAAGYYILKRKEKTAEKKKTKK